MKRILLVSVLFISFYSCIPLRVAPSIDDYHVTEGKDFQRKLPKRQMFIFEDSKDDGHFYAYINTKFNLQDDSVYDDVPFTIDNQQYFFSVYETEIPDKSINLFPLFFDVMMSAALGSDEVEPILSDGDAGYTRKGNWYIALEVYSDLEVDCLEQNSLSRQKVLSYLRALKNEYLSTHNYNEVLFKN